MIIVLGSLRSFKLLGMHILCKLGFFLNNFPTFVICLNDYTVISFCYIPEVPQNVTVYLLAYKADFKFKRDLLFWSQPITSSRVLPRLLTEINFRPSESIISGQINYELHRLKGTESWVMLCCVVLCYVICYVYVMLYVMLCHVTLLCFAMLCCNTSWITVLQRQSVGFSWSMRMN